MADTYLTPAHINPKIDVFGTSQHFNFYERFNSFVLFNKFTPTLLLDSTINFDFTNINFNGFRFKHTINSSSALGTFSFNYFLNNDYLGTPLFTATENGIFFNINAKGNTPILGNDFTIKSYVDNKVFDLTSNTSGELSISRLSGYPANSNLFLRGDGTWNTIPIININSGTTGQLNISRLQNYPASSSVFLRGDGQWVNIPSIDINSGTSGQLNLSRLSGYPNNSSLFLRGDGTWNSPITPIIDINNGTTNQLNVSRINGYPANSNLFLRGDGQWANAVTQFPVTVTTSNSSLEVISTYNYNSSAYGTGIGFYNQNSNGIIFGLNNSTSEGYVWSTNNISLKFGTNNILRMQIYNDGSIDCFSNNLNTTGSIAAGSFYSNNWSSYSLPYIYINSPVSNLTLYSDLKLNGNRITDSNGLHRMSFVGGTLEVSSGITTGRYYSYGFLNSSGGTGAASGTNYYSIVCQDRIAASEFNATSSKKIKKIIPNLNIENLKQKFLNLNFYQYNYIDNSDGQGDHYGVIAEDLSLIFPQFVDMEKERHIPNCIDEQGKMESIYFNGKEKDVYKFNHKLNLNNIDKSSKFVRLFINKIFYKASIINITSKKLYIYFENNDKITIDEYLKNNKVIYIYGTYEKCPTVEKNKLFEIGLILLQELLKKTN